MNAEEIRDFAVKSIHGLEEGKVSVESLPAVFLAEIAAQLAEMNDLRRGANPLRASMLGHSSTCSNASVASKVVAWNYCAECGGYIGK